MHNVHNVPVYFLRLSESQKVNGYLPQGVVVRVDGPNSRIWNLNESEANYTVTTLQECIKQVMDRNPDKQFAIKSVSISNSFNSETGISGDGRWFNSDYYSGLRVSSKVIKASCIDLIENGSLYRGVVPTFFLY